MYSSYHLSFTSTLPRSLLEELASLILANDPSGSTGQLISSVHDQYLDFLVPSQNLFSLLPRRTTLPDTNPPKKGSQSKPKEIEDRPSYAVLNDPKAGELEIESEVERVAKGLFSVIVTMGFIPVIRCPRGNAAEMVARQLDKKLRDHLAASSQRGGRDAYGSDGLSSLQRPCELITAGQRNVS